jgi:hypothetical protein
MENKHYKLGDDLIAVIRELIQLSILTGTNVVDHFRAITFEIHDETNKAVPTQEYLDAYSDMMEKLQEKAEQAQRESESKRKQLVESELATVIDVSGQNKRSDA